MLAANGIPVCPTLGSFVTATFVHAHERVKQIMARAGLALETVVEKRRAWMRRMA